jgi:hypothetical protein
MVKRLTLDEKFARNMTRSHQVSLCVAMPVRSIFDVRVNADGPTTRHSPSFHTVHVEHNSYHCSCKDFRHRSDHFERPRSLFAGLPCKHILYVFRLKQGKEWTLGVDKITEAS